MLTRLCPTRQALLRSQSGPGRFCHLPAFPTGMELHLANDSFRVCLLRRRRSPLGLSEQRCNGSTCRAPLDTFGDHRAACPRSGRLRRRAPPMEMMLERIFREAGARVRRNVLVRDLNLETVDPRDERRMKVIAEGLGFPPDATRHFQMFE